MNIVTEPKISGKPIEEPSRKRPVRMVLWFIIVGSLLAALVGGLVWFNYFRGQMIAQFFANNKPPPMNVSVVEAKSEVVPNLLTAVGELAAVHQVNVTSDVSGRVTEILFNASSYRFAGYVRDGIETVITKEVTVSGPGSLTPVVIRPKPVAVLPARH